MLTAHVQCVYPEFFKENPDHTHPEYSTECGIYKPNCGLSELIMRYGAASVMVLMGGVAAGGTMSTCIRFALATAALFQTLLWYGSCLKLYRR